MSSVNFQTQVLVPPQYGRRWLSSSGGGGGGSGQFLPLSGGTMTGVINMAGNKIINLGQTNLISTDAINLSTLNTASSFSTVPSIGISGNLQVEPPYSPEYTVLTPASWKTRVHYNYLYQLAPGHFTKSAGIRSSNWSLVSTSSGVLGYAIGSNNAPATFKKVKAICQYQVQLKAGSPPFFANLVAFSQANGQLLQLSNATLIQPGITIGAQEIDLSSYLTEFSQMETTALALLCSTNDSFQPADAIEQCQLTNMHYIFDV